MARSPNKRDLPNPYASRSTRGKQQQRLNALPSTHPLKNASNESKLIKHVQDRLDLANNVREPLTKRFADIDKEFACYLVLDKADQKRRRSNQQGKAPKPTAQKLPLAATQIDEEVTYLTEIFLPDHGIFEAATDAARQPIANGLSALMNKHAKRGQYVRHLSKFFDNSLRYNFGVLGVEWSEQQGNRIVRDPSGRISSQRDVIWSGNVLKALDVYNFLWDPAVHPVDLPMHGEFFATVRMLSEFRLRKLEADGEFLKVSDALSDFKLGAPNCRRFYQAPPKVRTDGTTVPDAWDEVLAPGTTSASMTGAEVVDYVGWINPKFFGLSGDDELQIWRLSFLNMTYLADAVHLSNAHGLLPVGISSPIEDELGLEQKSFGERLLPLQEFGSFLMNSHVGATRKAIYGVTVYDRNAIDFDEVEDDVSLRIPMKDNVQNKSVRDVLHHYNDAPNTNHTMQSLEQVMALAQKILPTDIMRQVADLERATVYQSAAVVQGGHRRSHKLAKVIDDQAMASIRLMMLYNIWQYQTEVSLIDPATGQPVSVKPSEINSDDIEFVVSDGLKGIDRMMMLTMIRDVLMMLVQHPAAAAEIDMLSVINYYTTLFGDRMNLTSFRKKPQEQLKSAALQDPAAIAAAAAEQEAASQGMSGPMMQGAM